MQYYKKNPQGGKRIEEEDRSLNTLTKKQTCGGGGREIETQSSSYTLGGGERKERMRERVEGGREQEVIGEYEMGTSAQTYGHWAERLIGDDCSEGNNQALIPMALIPQETTGEVWREGKEVESIPYPRPRGQKLLELHIPTLPPALVGTEMRDINTNNEAIKKILTREQTKECPKGFINHPDPPQVLLQKMCENGMGPPSILHTMNTSSICSKIISKGLNLGTF